MVATAQPDKLWDPIAARWARTHGAAILSELSREEGALSEALPATSSSTARAVSLPTTNPTMCDGDHMCSRGAMYV